MPRSPYSSRNVIYSFGPSLTPAVKFLIYTNVAVFILEWIFPQIVPLAGLTPAAVFEQFWVWQVVTYMFVHADVVHLLLNMLTLWMFGSELERLWGTNAFVRYYLITGVGAGFIRRPRAGRG